MFWNKPRPKNESEILKIKASINKQIRATSEVKMEIFLLKSKFLGFVEALVGVFFHFSKFQSLLFKSFQYIYFQFSTQVLYFTSICFYTNFQKLFCLGKVEKCIILTENQKLLKIFDKIPECLS